MRLLKERALAHQLKNQELKRQRDSRRRTTPGVSQFVNDCPAGRLTSLDAEIETLDGEPHAIEEELKANKAALKG